MNKLQSQNSNALLSKALLIVLGLILGLSSNSQNIHATSDTSKIRFEKWFDSQIGTDNTEFYNGMLYPLRRKVNFGHPFFGNGQWVNGSVVNKGHSHSDVELLFDLVDNLLIIKHPDGDLMNGIVLINRNIGEFKLDDISFTARKENDVTQFYELLYQGNSIDLLAKHVKKVDVRPDGSYIRSSTLYYIESNGQLSELKSKKSLSEIDAEALTHIKSLAKQGIKFQLGKRERLISFIQHFDEKLD